MKMLAQSSTTVVNVQKRHTRTPHIVDILPHNTLEAITQAIRVREKPFRVASPPFYMIRAPPSLRIAWLMLPTNHLRRFEVAQARKIYTKVDIKHPPCLHQPKQRGIIPPV